MNVSDVMTKDPVSVTPETSLKDVSRLLLERRISGVPVVAGETVVGVISDRDILYKERGSDAFEHAGFLGRLFGRGRTRTEEEKVHARTVGEAMTSPAITVRPRLPVSEAAILMLDHGVNRLPVVDDGNWFGEVEKGRLVGIVTHADLVRAFARADDDLAAEIRDLIAKEQSIPDGRVDLRVDRGEVTLDGDVEWQLTAESLVSSIRRVPGVVSVDSRLRWHEHAPSL